MAGLSVLAVTPRPAEAFINQASLVSLTNAALAQPAPKIDLKITPNVIGGGFALGGHPKGQVTITPQTFPLTVLLRKEDPTNLVEIPSKVVIPPGQSVAIFSITTKRTNLDQRVRITASAPAIQQESTDSLLVEKLKLIFGGTESSDPGEDLTTTLALNTYAPAGGTVIRLQSDSPVLEVPSQVVIPAGGFYKGVPLSIPRVSVPTVVTVSAQIEGGPKRYRTFHIMPPLLIGFEIIEDTIEGGGSYTVTLVVDRPISQDVIVTLSSNSPGVPTTRITLPRFQRELTTRIRSNAVAALFKATVVAQSPGSKKFVDLLTLKPPTLTGNQITPTEVTGGNTAKGTVMISVPAPDGGLKVALNSNAASASVPATVTIPGGAKAVDYTITTTRPVFPVQATIRASSNGVAQAAVLNVNPFVLFNHTLSATSVKGGTGVTGTVSIDPPAPAGGLTVSLRSNRPAVGVPATVTIPAGASSVNYAITTTGVTQLVQATLYATANGRTKWVVLNVNP